MQFIKPIIVGAHNPMNNANISSPNTKNKNTENPIENTTHINPINSDKGGVNLDFIIINIFGIVNFTI